MDDIDFKLEDILNEYKDKTAKNSEKSTDTLDDIISSVKDEAADTVAAMTEDISFSKPDEHKPAAEPADILTEEIPAESEAVEKDPEADTANKAQPEPEVTEGLDSPDEADNTDDTSDKPDDNTEPEQTARESENEGEPESGAEPVIPEEKPAEIIKNEAADKAERPAVKKQPVKKNESSSKNKQTAKKPVKNKKKKKKAKARVNNSIFGGLIIISLILTASIILAYGGIKLGMEYLGVGKNQNDITFNIPEGATADEVVDLLESNGIITQPKLFKLIMKMQNKTYYPGDITLQPSMSYTAIITALSENRGLRDTVSITFPEGITLLDAANMIEANNVCSKSDFIFQFNKKQGFEFENLIEETDLTFYKMEGYFFPDTYEFYVNDDAYNVTRIIREHFEEKYEQDIMPKLQQSGMTLNEVVTLASIVQREAGTVKDMPIVASVFLNRLNDPSFYPKMLQSDATSNYIEYVIKVAADTNVSIAHFSESYDTYNFEGLPAGPICSPGLDAILAVLEPSDTEYFYFCNNLDTGKAYYAKTLKEHEKNLVKAGLVEAE